MCCSKDETGVETRMMKDYVVKRRASINLFDKAMTLLLFLALPMECLVVVLHRHEEEEEEDGSVFR